MCLGETECNETLSLYLRRTKNWKVERERERIEKGSRERIEIERKKTKLKI